jgi:hypothetical protein
MNTSQITMAETQVTTAIKLSSPRANRRNVGGAGAVRADCTMHEDEGRKDVIDVL